MKTAIIKYLETDRSYRGGVSLVLKYSPKLGLKKQLNIHPQSDYLQGCIIEELRELAGIKTSDLKIILLKAVVISSREIKPSFALGLDEPLKSDDEYLSRFPEPETVIPKVSLPATGRSKKKVEPVKKPSRKK